MSKTITISDETYENVVNAMTLKGLQNVEQYLNEVARLEQSAHEWQQELERRRELGKRIDRLREKIFNEHGVMPDSTPLIREDRER